MTPRSFFNIVLKIFGLFFLKDIILFVPQFISAFAFVFQSNGISDNPLDGIGLGGLLVTLLFLAFYVYIVYLLLFKTDNISDKLKLDKDFEEESFSINFQTPFIINLALIIVAGVILIDEIPNFSINVYDYFQTRGQILSLNAPGFAGILYSAIKIILALLIIGERKSIVAFIEKRQESKEAEKASENNS